MRVRLTTGSMPGVLRSRSSLAGQSGLEWMVVAAILERDHDGSQKTTMASGDLFR